MKSITEKQFDAQLERIRLGFIPARRNKKNAQILSEPKILKKEKTTMETSNKRTIIVSVTMTILIITSIAGIFMAGMKMQQKLDDQTRATVDSQVAQKLKLSKGQQ